MFMLHIITKSNSQEYTCEFTQPNLMIVCCYTATTNNTNKHNVFIDQS